MIRFINLDNQITLDETKEFAWFDTIVDRFIEFNGTHVWSSWEEFEGDYEHDETMPLSRFEGLFPKKMRSRGIAPDGRAR